MPPPSKERAAGASKKTAAAPASSENAARPEGKVETEKPADAAAATKTGGPIAVGALHGKVSKKVDPAYPQIARAARISGVVTVFLVLDEKGAVESVQRADGPAQLQPAATAAVRRWKFKPTLVDGQPVRVTGYINFNFSL
jgi:periplasmic protein TonB